MSASASIIEIATSQLGVTETPKGSNSGKDVEKYLKSVGLGKGYAWCMAFAYWVVQEACAKAGVASQLKKTGGVMAQWNASPGLRIKTPIAPCLFIIDHGKGLGHTGIVTKVLLSGKIETIEGNTNDEGSRDGYEVCRRVRTISSCKGFIKLP